MRQESIRRIISICLLALLVAVFSLTSSYFLAPKNVYAFLRDASVTGILAVGVTFVIITAGIDLSTGALTALSAMIMANFLFYLPVAIFAHDRPKLGILMIPKTMCYIWMLSVICFF